MPRFRPVFMWIFWEVATTYSLANRRSAARARSTDDGSADRGSGAREAPIASPGASWARGDPSIASGAVRSSSRLMMSSGSGAGTPGRAAAEASGGGVEPGGGSGGPRGPPTSHSIGGRDVGMGALRRLARGRHDIGFRGGSGVEAQRPERGGRPDFSFGPADQRRARSGAEHFALEHHAGQAAVRLRLAPQQARHDAERTRLEQSARKTRSVARRRPGLGRQALHALDSGGTVPGCRGLRRRRTGLLRRERLEGQAHREYCALAESPRPLRRRAGVRSHTAARGLDVARGFVHRLAEPIVARRNVRELSTTRGTDTWAGGQRRRSGGVRALQVLSERDKVNRLTLFARARRRGFLREAGQVLTQRVEVDRRSGQNRLPAPGARGALGAAGGFRIPAASSSVTPCWRRISRTRVGSAPFGIMLRIAPSCRARAAPRVACGCAPGGGGGNVRPVRAWKRALRSPIPDSGIRAAGTPRRVICCASSIRRSAPSVSAAPPGIPLPYSRSTSCSAPAKLISG